MFSDKSISPSLREPKIFPRLLKVGGMVWQLKHCDFVSFRTIYKSSTNTIDDIDYMSMKPYRTDILQYMYSFTEYVYSFTIHVHEWTWVN